MFITQISSFSPLSAPLSSSLRTFAISALAAGFVALTGCATGNSPERAISTLCAPDAPFKDYNQRTLLGVGYEALKANNLNCAERLFSEAHKLDAKDPWALLNLGVTRQRLGQSDAARVAYQAAAALDPKTSGIELKADAISEQQREVAVVSTNGGALKQSAGEIALQNLKRMR